MKTAFIVSGVLGLFIWPGAMVAGAMLFDTENVPPHAEMLRQIAFYSMLPAPLIWVAALVLAIIESKRRKRPRVLRAFAIAPYAAAGVHALALVALLNLA
jgi:membrane protein DedA with SNARE-associated domain